MYSIVRKKAIRKGLLKKVSCVFCGFIEYEDMFHPIQSVEDKKNKLPCKEYACMECIMKRM